MKVEYNILIKPKFDANISQSMQKLCLKAAQGFLGEHYVNHFGRVFDGLDKNCETYYEAEFDFFNRTSEETLDDALTRLETKKLFLGGDEQVEFEESINTMNSLKNATETRDPTLFFYNSWGKYRNATVPEPFKINTPLGAQDSHVHILPSLSILRFYKPNKEKRWYDYDLLKGFTFDAMFVGEDLRLMQEETNNPIRKYFTIPLQKLKVKQIKDYQEKLMSLDSINKINIRNDYYLPEYVSKK